MHVSDILDAHGAPLEIVELFAGFDVAKRGESNSLICGISVLGNVFCLLPIAADFDSVQAVLPEVSSVLGSHAIFGAIELTAVEDGYEAYREVAYVNGTIAREGSFDGVLWARESSEDDMWAEVDDYVSSPDYDAPMSAEDIFRLLDDIAGL